MKGNDINDDKSNQTHWQLDRRILLIDDLFSAGNTLIECVQVLKTDKLVNDIYVLTITKTGVRE